MSRPAQGQVRAGLRPSPGDTRLPRLGKLAALALLDAGRPVTRSTLTAMSKKVDDEPGRKKPGFSEASLSTNKELGKVYRLARSSPIRTNFKRRGHVGAHVLRMTKATIASALIVARMATAEREAEHRMALLRLGEPFEAKAVSTARDARSALPVNRIPDHGREAHPRAAALKVDAAVAHAAAIDRAKRWALRRGIRPTAEWLAGRCNLHPGTVERIAMTAATAAVNADTFDFEVTLPPSLLRHAKWDLARALQAERTYIKALHDTTMAIGIIVIDREHLLRRAEVRATQGHRAILPGEGRHGP